MDIEWINEHYKEANKILDLPEKSMNGLILSILTSQVD